MNDVAPEVVNEIQRLRGYVGDSAARFASQIRMVRIGQIRSQMQTHLYIPRYTFSRVST